jgi:hypothetical protein
MKISQQTLSILKNFATINGNILVRAGSNLSTISPQKNILANANVAESFPLEFAIYDLSQFLSAVSLFEDADFDFAEKYVTISSGRRSIKYFYAEPSMILSAPEKKLVLPSTEVDFVATAGNISEVLKASAVLQTPEIVVASESHSTQIELIATAVNNNTSNRYAVNVDATTEDTFRMVFKSENLKLIPGDYRISISSKGMGRFFNEKLGLEYFIATETTSKYGA